MGESESRRKRPHDADAARTTILDAAEVVFAQRGFAGARVDTIAAEAGYNKSLIFQYFGDKLRLYAAVVKRADQHADDLRARVFPPLLENPGIVSDGHALRAFFMRAFGAVFDHLIAHPQMLRILLWEMADGWQTYARIRSHVQPHDVTQLNVLFQEAQRAGLIRSAFVPAIQLTLALQICETFLANRPLFQLLVPMEELSSPAADARARDYIVGLVVAGIMVDPLSTHEPREDYPP
jgi:AcrR family transcriptional regulator